MSVLISLYYLAKLRVSVLKGIVHLAARTFAASQYVREIERE